MILINLIISTYAGRYYKFEGTNNTTNLDRENYLKYCLLCINENVSNLSQITIMKPRVNSEHTEMVDYYNFDNLKIEKIRDKIKIFPCENIGISYGQFFTAIFKDTNFDYYIFIEDDYFPFSNNFDSKLVELSQSYNDDFFTCSFINNKKTNIFDKELSQSNKIALSNYFKHYNLCDYNIILPDFSLGILSNKCVKKLISTYYNINNILEIYKLKYNHNWYYQVLFGYTFTIAGVYMNDFNKNFLNIFYESSNASLYLCNLEDNYHKKSQNLPYNNTSYRTPLFLPIDIFYPNNYSNDIISFKKYLFYKEKFNELYNNYNKIKYQYMIKNNILNDNISVYFYINKNNIDYMPFYLYVTSVVKIFKKNITNNVKITCSPEVIRDVKPNVIFTFSLSVTDIYNYFYPEQIKFIINTENYKTREINTDLIELNRRKNIFFIDYNAININFIQDNFKNISCLYIPQLYHNFLNEYYNELVKQKFSFSDKDIDILFYGNYNFPRRLNIINQLISKYNVKLVFKDSNINVCQFIERSKIVLNIFSMEDNKPFDYYRNIFLLANQVLLVSEYPESIDNEIDKILHNISQELIVPEYDDIISTIDMILDRYNDKDYINSLIDKQTNFVKKNKMSEYYINLIPKLFDSKI